MVHPPKGAGYQIGSRMGTQFLGTSLGADAN
jgi:hypothetical protein